MIRWTAEKVEELRGLAHLGSPAIGRHFGITASAARSRASKHHIPLCAPRRVRMTEDDKLRARWAARLPQLKALVRKDMARIMAQEPRVSAPSS